MSYLFCFYDDGEMAICFDKSFMKVHLDENVLAPTPVHMATPSQSIDLWK